MKKLKVLVVPSDRTGVSYFRSINPHLALENNYPDEFNVDIDYEPQLDNDEWLKQYDIIHYHRTLGPFEKMQALNKRLEDMGIVSIMDLDDYWAPGPHHPAYLLIKNAGLDVKILNNLKVAQNITTTTSVFAKEIQKFNKNVYVLPNAIDPTEAQFISNPEPSDRIRIGWLGGSCKSFDTEILTENGWVFFPDLTEGVKVATLNPNTNEIEYHLPKRYIKEKFTGDMYVCDTDYINFKATGNHNMYVSEVKNLGHKKLDFKLTHAEDMWGKDYHYKKDGINTNKDVEFFTLPSIQQTPFDKNDYSEKKILMDDWLKFLGFWLADGWTTNSKGCHQVGVCQFKNNNFLVEISNVLKKYGFKSDINKKGDRIVLHNRQLWSYLKQFGGASEKFIPRELLNKLSEKQLGVLLEWFLNGDGSKEQYGEYVRKRAYTVSKQLSDDLMELAFKMGNAASIKNRGLRTPKISLKENGKERLINPNFESYQIGFYEKNSKHNKLTPLVRKEDLHKEFYDDYVYCVEVENHIIHVRRNGKAMWTGNSHLKDLEILKGVVNRLESDGLLNKIQFVLCGFDLRGTHTEIDKNTGEQRVRNILPMESVWYQYEKIFTNDYKTVSPEYKDFLLKFTNAEFAGVANEPYRRVWTKHISTYATNYNLFDISLAPLSENTFNHCKCIVGDSLISTNNGFKHIEDIVNKKTPLKTEINGVTNEVCNYFKYEDVETIKITTEDGYFLEGTPHHKILVKDKWVELKDLSVGDTVELSKPEFLQTEYQEITYPMLLTKNITEEKIANSDENMLPRIRINENWGRLLGYLLGDGNYNGKSGISISCDKRHQEVVDDVTGLLKSIGLNPLLYNKKPDKRCINYLAKEGNALDIKSTCINFLSISKKYGWCGIKGKTFRVPKVILESPKSVVAEFLKGLFEADGTVGENTGVSLTSKDLTLIRQVQTLLLGFDIKTKIKYSFNKNYNKYYYNLNLYRLGSEIFQKEIGFVSKHKKELLGILCSHEHSNNEKKINMVTKISTIEKSINSVYDIEVENVHSYNANGIINHNSQLKVIEAGFHHKAIIAQDFGPYQIDLTNAIQFGGSFDTSANSILVETKKNHKDWYTAIKKLINNPEMIKVLQDNLYNTVKDKYSVTKVTEERRNLYLSLVKANKPAM